ncbi:nucleotide exchange factor GrpE [Methylopila sp. Yamaguchi]|uniref:nucleotide exchange factor GrpE n=1 Tax=Methylopila sp. Yamaguchi TaxID=1437817 RepID=UPI000CA8FAAC|nr:nucleotide exchange factor GrpE [Methylopila sp. Yamaguchi]GBD50150.1 heat shock protein GrpE-like protein [Methylopila sp. Yamaguchi]
MNETTNSTGEAGADRERLKGEAAPNKSVAELADELATTKDRLLRSLAEQENGRELARRQREDAVRYAASAFARDLLATADNLERAIASAPTDLRSEPAVAALIAGVEATRRGLLDAFTKHGLQRLDPIGETFDPHRHQASFEVADARYQPGVVAQVIQPGYMHHERLLRPALVGVSKDAAPAGAPREA